jgi:hypothetical protein
LILSLKKKRLTKKFDLLLKKMVMFSFSFFIDVQKIGVHTIPEVLKALKWLEILGMSLCAEDGNASYKKICG